MFFSHFSEQEILREEITSLQAVRGRLQLRITQLEEELKRVKEDSEKKEKEHTEKGEDEVLKAWKHNYTKEVLKMWSWFAFYTLCSTNWSNLTKRGFLGGFFVLIFLMGIPIQVQTFDWCKALSWFLPGRICSKET